MLNDKLRVVAMGVVALVWLSLPATAFAWIYPEHRDIAVGAVEQLDPERRAVFDRLWRDARIAHEMRLCEQGADAKQGVKPPCIDWAALSAIAGDHSCSSKDLTAVVLQSDWILSVADVAARLKEDLSQIDVLPPSQQDPGSKDAIADIRRRMQSETARAARLNALRSRGPPAPARRSPICQPGGLQQRSLPAASPIDRHDLRGLRGAHASAWFRNQRDRGLRLVSPQRHGEGHAARQRAAGA